MTTPFTTQGILIHDPTSIPFTTIFASRLEIVKSDWKYLLKSAVFRSFSKYTGFTSSLDMKMEADSLLWEKINGGKFITKMKNNIDEKSGMIVDMTRKSGYLEFIEYDNVMYDSSLGNQKVLAYWKVKIFDKNRVWIQIVIPQEPPVQHTFEYVPGFGLKEIKTKDNFYNKAKTQNLPQLWKNTQYVDQLPEPEMLASPLDAVKRQDHYIVRMRQYDNNIKNPRQIIYRQQNPRTIVFKPTPTVYYPTYEPIYSTPKTKYSTWRQEQTYYPMNQIKTLPEFKQETEYNGFIPSMGPSSNRPLYETPIEQQYTYPNAYIPIYTEPPPTYKPLTIPVTFNFKPSTQFVQYSDPDPFYNSEENLTYIPINDNYPIIGNLDGVSSIKTINYDHLPSTVTVQIPNNIATVNEYEKDSRNVNNENTTQSTELIIDEITTIIPIKNNEDILKDKQYTTTAMTKPTSERTIKTRNNLKNPHISSLTAEESYNYAPLYIRWGQKLKTSKTKPKFENRTKEFIRPYYKAHISKVKLNRNITNEFTTSIPELSTITEESTITNTETTTNFDIVTTYAPKFIYKNNQINNRTGKSKEEIVHDLTRIGLKNSLKMNKTKNDELSSLRVNKMLTNLNKYLTEIPPISSSTTTTTTTTTVPDNQEMPSEPISMVINRISKSITYKTSEGHTGHIKQLLEKT